MRITHDKNGHPFGYCEAECSQQLRIGGDVRRVRKFLARFPWAAGTGEPATAPAAPAAPVTATVPAPATKGGQDDFDNWRQGGAPAKKPKARGGLGVFDALMG